MSELSSDQHRHMHVSRVFVFAGGTSAGNEAAVLVCAERFPTDQEMQRISADLGTPATVFAGIMNDRYPVRFFTPKTELPFCGHGALAAGSVLAHRLGRPRVTLLAGSGPAQIDCSDPQIVTVALEKNPTVETEFDREGILACLGITAQQLDLNLPFAIASVGSPKCLVPVANTEILRGLAPNSVQLAEWSHHHQVNGAYVYTCTGIPAGVHALARAFNPKTGAEEDAATGVAAAPLGWVLRDRWGNAPWFIVDQGIGLRNLNRLCVRVDERGMLQVGGAVRFAGI